jgi:hypothetical protein
MVTKTIATLAYATPLLPYWLLWRDFQTIWERLERRSDLERLVRWAQRKKLKGVQYHYQRLLTETELLLIDNRIRRYRLTVWVSRLHFMIRALLTATIKYQKGAAAKYRLRK